jgi:predicted nuclease of predicted toxin-antitoxin system
MACLYADEQFPYQVVEHLRDLGHDVLTVQEAGNANLKIPDDEVLAFASSNERVILTQYSSVKHFFLPFASLASLAVR